VPIMHGVPSDAAGAGARRRVGWGGGGGMSYDYDAQCYHNTGEQLGLAGVWLGRGRVGGGRGRVAGGVRVVAGPDGRGRMLRRGRWLRGAAGSCQPQGIVLFLQLGDVTLGCSETTTGASLRGKKVTSTPADAEGVAAAGAGEWTV
jgi:hypothetical protein